MYALASVAYVVSIVSFVLIYMDASQRSYTDTIIESYDKTGQDGYTCQMISVANKVYTEKANMSTSPSFEYYLVNVMEIASQYEHDVTQVDPCSSPQQYFPGTFANPFPTELVDFGGVTLYGADMAYMTATWSTPTINYYNFTAGTFTSYHCKTTILVGSLAVDRNGYAIYIAYISWLNSEEFGIFRAMPDANGVNGDADEMLFNITTTTLPVALLNDNLYNIYLVMNTSVIAVDVYGSAGMTVLFHLGAGDTIQYAAVYNSGHSLKVYYINGTDYCISWENGVFTTEQKVNQARAIAVDGLDHLYFTVLTDLFGKAC